MLKIRKVTNIFFPRSIIATSFFSLLQITVFGQFEKKLDGNSVNSQFIIQQIEIKDRGLIGYIKEYIDANECKSMLFNKGLGFIVIEDINLSTLSGRPMEASMHQEFNEANSSFKISIKAYPLILQDEAECLLCNYFPPYYSIIEDRIILIYEENILHFLGRLQANDLKTNRFYTKDSKEKLADLVMIKSIVELADNYTFKDFPFEENLTYSSLKKRRVRKEEVLFFYEFINFEADEVVYFDYKAQKWAARK